MHETATKEHTIQTIDRAFEMLDLRRSIHAPSELARFPHAPIGTTCQEIPSRELDLVETDSELTLWGTLNPDAWAQRTDWADANGAVAIDQISVSDKRGGELSVWPAKLPKAKRLQGQGMYVDFLYDEEARGYDGMFRVVVQKGATSTAEEQKQLLETGFGIATGEMIFNQNKVVDSDATLKQAMYREHYKVGVDDPLSDEQKVAVARLRVEMTTNGRQHVIDPAKHIDGRIVGVRHQVKRADNIVGMLLDRELLSANQRIVTGAFQTGRSTAPDIGAGGSDSVYTYPQLEGYSEASTVMPSVLFKRRVLERLDVRGYAKDAYGSRESETPSIIDKLFQRPPIKKDVVEVHHYDDRVQPDLYADQDKVVSELCFETSMDTEDIDKIVMPNEPTSWFLDTNWDRVLAPYANNTRQLVNTLQATTEADGATAGIRFLTKDLGMPQEQAAYYLLGVGEPSMRERLLKKLSILGVTQISDRSTEDVIVDVL